MRISDWSSDVCSSDLTVDSHFVEQTQAAGFRQRREGLAYRLSWLRPGVRPRKRVAPASHGLPRRRKLIYRVRNHIALWSHRIFYLARRTRRPGIYIRWARGMLMIYQGLTYSRGDRKSTRLNSSH